MNYLPNARTENIVIQDFAKELLIYDLVSNKALCLNETSKIIWQACDGKTTFDEFRRKTNLQFSDELIWLALEQLKRDYLLDNCDEIEPKFNGLNRRQVIRKVGVSSLIALPIIASIAAPMAVNAQSITCPAGQTNCSGICRDLSFDAANCGMCGVVCSFPNAVAFCSTSLCGIAACNAGFANCNGVTGDGCEINLTNNPLNCGSCGMSCGGATPNCVGSVCVA